MRISASIHQFEFHDASIDTIVYSSQAQLLRFSIEFSEWVKLDHHTGHLVFYGVQQLTSVPNLALLEWDNHFFGDVIEFKHAPELDQTGAEGVRASMLLIDYEKGAQGVLAIEFSATNFEWVPHT